MKKPIIILIVFIVLVTLYYAIGIIGTYINTTAAENRKFVTIQQGVISLPCMSGQTITIEGPAKYQQYSKGNTLHIYKGKAYCSNSANGIAQPVVAGDTICTCTTMNTSYGIYVHRNGNTEIHVNTGELIIITIGKDAALATLKGGQAVLVAPNGTKKNIPLDITQFKKLPTPQENPDSPQQ